MMNPETLQVALTAYTGQQPFHPFTLVMNDGVRLEVDSPLAVAFSAENGRMVFLGPGGVPQIFNSESVNRVMGDLAGVDGAASADREAA